MNKTTIIILSLTILLLTGCEDTTMYTYNNQTIVDGSLNIIGNITANNIPTNVVNGSGILNSFALWTSENSLGNGSLSEDATYVRVGKPLIIDGSPYISNDSFVAGDWIVNGSVGIGTSSPSTKLEVNGGASTAFSVFPEASTGRIYMGSIASYNYISLNNKTTVGDYNFLSRATDPSLVINRPLTGDIAFRENNSGQMIIKSGGNVGIGTTSPTELLHIKSAVNDTNIKLNPQNNVVSGYVGRYQRNADTTGGGSYYTYIANGAYHQRGKDELTFQAHNMYVDAQVMQMNLDGFKFLFANVPSNDVEVTMSEYMRIDSTGKVGIGTTRPTQKLDVNGSVNITGVAYVNGSQVCTATNGVCPSGSGSVSNINTTFLSRDFSHTSTSYLLLNNLTFELQNNSLYNVICNLVANTNVTGNSPRFRFNVSGTSLGVTQNCETSTSGTARYQIGALTGSLACVSTASIDNSLPTPFYYIGTIRTNTTLKQNFTVEFYGEASSTNYTIYQGGTCEFKKLI